MKNFQYQWYDYLPSYLRRVFYRKWISDKYSYLMSLRNNNYSKQYNLDGFDKNKCIFVHVPKCAGISVTKALFGNLAGGHTTIMEYKIIYDYFEFNNFYKFSFVRNPWDRIYSAYTFLKKGGLNDVDKHWANENLSEYTDFNHFVLEWVNEENVNSWMHFIPQYKYLCNAYGKVMVDYVGRFETLNEDFYYVSRILKLNVELTHKNKSEANDISYKNIYTSKSKNIIAEVYKKDIELFHYEF